MNINITPSVKKWIKAIIVSIVALFGFSYLYSRGISPVWLAILIVLFPGLFRFLYKVICFLVAVAIVITIIGFLIF